MASIGTLNEGHLHASLKALYSEPGDALEVPLDGYCVDILRGELVIEVQTSSFAHIAKKLRALVEQRPVRLVHPIAAERWLVKRPRRGHAVPARRRSPKRLGFEEIFDELVSFPELLAHENFELEIVTTQEDEILEYRGGRHWRRRGWVVAERRLLGVVDHLRLRGPADLLALLPETLPDPFETKQLADAFGRPRWFAQRTAYCLRKAGAVQEIGKAGNARIYSRLCGPPDAAAASPR